MATTTSDLDIAQAMSAAKSTPTNQSLSSPSPSASSESVTQPLSQTPSTSKKIPSLLDQQIKRPRKRHFGSEDEEENVSSIWRPQARFSPFLVVEQLPGVQISKTAPCSSLSELSVFKIATELKNQKICSIDDAQKHGNTLLVKVGTASDSDRLLQCVEFCGLPVRVKPHSTLNCSKGVVRNGWFKDATAEEMEQISGVTEADEIITKKDGKPYRTGLWVLTFDTPVCPQHIDVHWLKRIPVRPYIPKPMRCFKCQKFGHKGQKCRSRADICVRCGAKEKHTNCDKPPKCSNCMGDHAASDRSCAEYQKNQNILKHKANYGGTFAQARETLYPRGPSYSGAVKGALSDTKQSSKTSSSQSKEITKSRTSPTGVKAPILRDSSGIKVQNRFAPLIPGTFSFPPGTSPSPSPFSSTPSPAPQESEMESETTPSIPKGSTLTSTNLSKNPTPPPPAPLLPLKPQNQFPLPNPLSLHPYPHPNLRILKILLSKQ